MNFPVIACEKISQSEKDFFSSRCSYFHSDHPSLLPEGVKRGDIIWIKDHKSHLLGNGGRHFYDGEKIIEQEYDLNIDDYYGSIPKCFPFGQFPPMYWLKESYGYTFCCDFSSLDLEQLEKAFIENMNGDFSSRSFVYKNLPYKNLPFDREIFGLLMSAEVIIKGFTYKFFIKKSSVEKLSGIKLSGERHLDEETIIKGIKIIIQGIKEGKLVARNYYELPYAHNIVLDEELRDNVVVI